jgi:hypothetical protein
VLFGGRIGDNKSGDSANFGIFKQSWGMSRECASKFKGQSAGNYYNGAALKDVAPFLPSSSFPSSILAGLA